jgi:RNA polymerase sigma factor (sigma-70 family)
MNTSTGFSEHQFKSEVMIHQALVYRLAKGLLVSKEEAEDVVQEMMTRLWMQRDQLNQVDNKKAFIAKMTKNYCLDRLKSKQAQWVSWDNPHEKHAIWSPENSMDAQEGVEMIYRCLAQLPEMQRLIFQLRDIEGMEYKEIEEITGMQSVAVRVSLSRVRKTLKNHVLQQNQHGVKSKA